MYGWHETTRKQYAWMESDPATGLEHTDWRKYDEWQGRWTTADPYHGSMSAGDPQSMNRYAYVGNDPVNFTDPTGLQEFGNTPETAETITINSHGTPWNWGFLGGGGGSARHDAQDLMDQILILDGGGDSGPPQTASAQQPKSPCDGVKASDLKYDVPLAFGSGKNRTTETGREHIERNHTQGAAAGKSQYVTDPSVTGGALWAHIQGLNATTFQQGFAVIENDRIIVAHKFPTLPPSRPGTMGQKWIGQDQNGVPTAFNTLILGADCKTVYNSFPGLPFKSFEQKVGFPWGAPGP